MSSNDITSTGNRRPPRVSEPRWFDAASVEPVKSVPLRKTSPPNPVPAPRLKLSKARPASAAFVSTSVSIRTRPASSGPQRSTTSQGLRTPPYGTASCPGRDTNSVAVPNPATVQLPSQVSSPPPAQTEVLPTQTEVPPLPAQTEVPPLPAQTEVLPTQTEVPPLPAPPAERALLPQFGATLTRSDADAQSIVVDEHCSVPHGSTLSRAKKAMSNVAQRFGIHLKTADGADSAAPSRPAPQSSAVDPKGAGAINISDLHNAVRTIVRGSDEGPAAGGALGGGSARSATGSVKNKWKGAQPSIYELLKAETPTRSRLPRMASSSKTSSIIVRAPAGRETLTSSAAAAAVVVKMNESQRLEEAAVQQPQWLTVAANPLQVMGRPALEKAISALSTAEVIAMTKAFDSASPMDSLGDVVRALSLLGVTASGLQVDALLKALDIPPPSPTCRLHVNQFGRLCERVKLEQYYYWFNEDGTPKDVVALEAFKALGGSADGSGHVDISTFHRATQAFGIPVDMDQLVQALDRDKSGSVDFEEFAAGFHTLNLSSFATHKPPEPVLEEKESVLDVFKDDAGVWTDLIGPDAEEEENPNVHFLGYGMGDLQVELRQSYFAFPDATATETAPKNQVRERKNSIIADIVQPPFSAKPESAESSRRAMLSQNSFYYNTAAIMTPDQLKAATSLALRSFSDDSLVSSIPKPPSFYTHPEILSDVDLTVPFEDDLAGELKEGVTMAEMMEYNSHQGVFYIPLENLGDSDSQVEPEPAPPVRRRKSSVTGRRRSFSVYEDDDDIRSMVSRSASNLSGGSFATMGGSERLDPRLARLGRKVSRMRVRIDVAISHMWNAETTSKRKVRTLWRKELQKRVESKTCRSTGTISGFQAAVERRKVKAPAVVIQGSSSVQ